MIEFNELPLPVAVAEYTELIIIHSSKLSKTIISLR